MALNLDQFLGLRRWALTMRAYWLRLVKGVEIDSTAQASLSSLIWPGRRGSITIGPQTLVAFKTCIYTTDVVTGEDRPVRIGSRCFIGASSIILPGVTIGDECIIGAGSVVFQDVPPRSLAAGNPARIVKREIEVGPFGQLKRSGVLPL